MSELSHAVRVLDTLHQLFRQCHGRVRFEVLLAVARGPADVSTFADRLEVDVSQVSRCLQELDRAGLVQWKQCGHRRVYSVGPRVQSVPSPSGGTLVRLMSGRSSAVWVELSGDDAAAIDRVLGVPSRSDSDRSSCAHGPR